MRTWLLRWSLVRWLDGGWVLYFVMCWTLVSSNVFLSLCICAVIISCYVWQIDTIRPYIALWLSNYWSFLLKYLNVVVHVEMNILICYLFAGTGNPIPADIRRGEGAGKVSYPRVHSRAGKGLQHGYARRRVNTLPALNGPVAIPNSLCHLFVTWGTILFVYIYLFLGLGHWLGTP
jgi:hypothetical protein